MPPMIVVAAVGALVLLVIVLLVVRSKGKSEPEAPRFEPPRELAPQKPKEPPPPAQSAVPAPPPATSQAPAPPSGQFPVPAPEAPAQVSTPPVAPVQQIATPPIGMPAISVPPKAEEPPAQETTAALSAPPVAPPPPRDATPVPEAPKAEAKPAPPARPAPPAPAKPRQPLRSYSSIKDEDEGSGPAVEVKAPEPKPAPVAKPLPPPVAKISEPKLPATTPAVVAPPPKVSTGKMAAAVTPASAEHDFSALNDSKQKLPAAAPSAPAAEAKPVAAAPAPAAAPAAATPAPGTAAAIAAKYMQPSNPATAELEKGDPRHAAARRLARLSVSEIKLYHEAEVTEGRANKDLWTRLQTDIGLARQTYEARVVAEVRERFDYLLDEIVRQLAEGDASKLGAGAPAVKDAGAAAPAAPAAEAPAPAPVAEVPAPPPTPKPVPEAPKSAPKAEPKPAPVAAPAAAAPASEAAKPSGLAARGLPANPETAELEKNDPRHAAARRLSRLSVSEIKLYHEAEVLAGRENKDLWSRLQQDISLAMATYEKRVDKEVRDRFDYLYDELLRQLAEGDASKLGPGAPAPKKAAEAAPVSATPAAPSEAAPAPAAASPAAASPTTSGAAAKYIQPSNPATAELEKGDPRHAAARRFARLSVSEIKLYHEEEVKAGREAKDLWTRMSTDIGLAMQTYEKRVDKEVRDRFDYLYDEILRQLAEGDAAKLGPNAPKPKE